MSGPLAIDGVPASVTREQVCGLIEGLGLDPKEVCGLRFGFTGISVEVYALDPAGQRFTDDGKTMATHQVTIPIVEKDATT